MPDYFLSHHEWNASKHYLFGRIRNQFIHCPVVEMRVLTIDASRWLVPRIKQSSLEATIDCETQFCNAKILRVRVLS